MKDSLLLVYRLIVLYSYWSNRRCITRSLCQVPLCNNVLMQKAMKKGLTEPLHVYNQLHIKMYVHSNNTVL